MSFQLRTNEPVHAGLMRNVRSQLEKALKHLHASADPHQHDSAETDTVGEVRKCFKRIRAVLRLLREELGEDRYHRENYCFRDAARPLTQVRDAGILVETVDKLREHFPRTAPSATLANIRHALLANQNEVSRRVLEQDQAVAKVRQLTVQVLARLGEWRIERDGWAALEPGIGHVYRAAHRALTLAAESSSVAHLHEWRKQTKYLWHQLQLVEPVLGNAGKPLADATHRLSTLLGDDHDLAVLRETLAADPLSYGGHLNLKSVFNLIDRRRAALERQAFALGRQIYQDPAKVFTSRIAAALRHEDSNHEDSNEECHPV